MNLQQLEYIVALDNHRHFVKAAEACGVSQPTLSSLVQKLEEELDVIIFDRKSKPIQPTEIGKKIIDQARIVLYQTKSLKEITLSERELETGALHLGIIPTVAPYIVPKLFKKIHESYPLIELHISEMQTSVIIDHLRKAKIDMAILATPLEQDDLLEIPLYYEKFLAYISPLEPIYKTTDIEISAMPTEHLWVLKEGHCMRGQIFNFCQGTSQFSNLYEAGSIDTLINIVDENGGYTIIPELHISTLSNERKKHLRTLHQPVPVREISLIIRQDFLKEKMINHLVEAIKSIIPESMLDTRLKKFAIRL